MSINMTDGTLFKRETTPGGGTYTTIAQVMNITLPKKTRKTAEVFIHDQSAPVVKTGAFEAMECTIELAFDMDSVAHQAFETAIDAKTELRYQILFPNTGGATFTFDAVIKSLEYGDASAEGTDPQTATLTFALAAAATIAW
jgi:Lambda phage tail tube protein, TTP